MTWYRRIATFLNYSLPNCGLPAGPTGPSSRWPLGSVVPWSSRCRRGHDGLATNETSTGSCSRQ